MVYVGVNDKSLHIMFQKGIFYTGAGVAVGLEAPWRERESDAIVSLATLLTLPTLLITLHYLPFLALLVLLLLRSCW